MTGKDNQSPGMGEAARLFLSVLPPEEREASQQEVYRFVRWYGRERLFSGLTAPEVANYAERLSLSDTDYARKLERIRAFLVHAKKEEWSKTNLAVHLKPKKTKASAHSGKRGSPEIVSLTQQGYDKITAELAGLKDRSSKVLTDIQKAAADKDFRENAPLHAAREERGHIEGRIKQLEQTLKAAAVIGEQKSTVKANSGSSITLRDLTSGEELRYTIVHPKEVDAIRGKISSASPIGKAVVGRGEGETIEVAVPAGKLRYRIERVER